MGFGDGLVHRLVLADAALKVGLGLLTRHVLVVRVARGDLQRDVRGDDRGVVADGREQNEEVGRQNCTVVGRLWYGDTKRGLYSVVSNT